ncbi:MAG: sugar kinase [Endomicrobia bacterium]|nr:sugar kinase [Endomicrobiia bacterium]
MAKKYENRIVIVTRETRLQKVLTAQNTVSQAKFYISNLGGDFNDYKEEHDRYDISIKNVRNELESLANIQVIDRQYLTNFIFDKNDVVVAVGQDGLVANTIKYLDEQPVIGINPDSSRWDGILLPFKPENVRIIVEETIKGKRKTESVSMAKARVQNGQELYAVNDFFIGQRTHTSARYVLKYNGIKEPQSSSGIIVSTGLGSTGWMKSVISGAKRISSSVIGSPYGSSQENDALAADYAETPEMTASMKKLTDTVKKSEDLNIMQAPAQRQKQSFQAFNEKAAVKKKKEYGISELHGVIGKWASRDLVFAVREPFPSKTTGTTLVFGKIAENEILKIESLMGENGVIFSDGIENDFIAFNSGTEAVISLAEKKGRIVI